LKPGIKLNSQQIELTNVPAAFPYSIFFNTVTITPPLFPPKTECWLLVGGKTSKQKKLAKVQDWSPMDLPAKWHFSAYKFDMK